HRLVAERELASPPAGIGAMLPDLWRMIDRRVRPSLDVVRPERTGDAVLDALHGGVVHHLEADRWFHSHALFLEGERRVSARLRAACPATPRMGLFTHVAWELCLDGAL